MNLKDKLRTLFGIRTERASAPPGPKPPAGSSIVRDRLRMRLKYPINGAQWEWLTNHGWRTVDMRTNRRHYTFLPDKVLNTLLDAGELERELLHRKLVRMAETRAARSDRASDPEAREKARLRRSQNSVLRARK